MKKLAVQSVFASLLLLFLVQEEFFRHFDNKTTF